MFLSLLLATVSSGSSVGDVCSAAPLLCSGSQGSLQPDNYTTSTAAACCTLCSNKPDECFGWVWRKKTPESENGACHLKPPGVVQPCTGGDCTTPCGMLPPPPPTPHPKGAKNVLFIVSDDFRWERERLLPHAKAPRGGSPSVSPTRYTNQCMLTYAFHANVRVSC